MMEEKDYDELIGMLMEMSVVVPEDMSTHDSIVWMEGYGKCMMDITNRLAELKEEKRT